MKQQKRTAFVVELEPTAREGRIMNNEVPPSMSGWLSSSRPICASLSGVVLWAAMSACQQRCWIGLPIAQRFSNLSELLIAFASSSTDRKERREKRQSKSMFDRHLCARGGPLFDYKLAHVSVQKLFWSIVHLVKLSRKNWSTFPLQKTGVVCLSISSCLFLKYFTRFSIDNGQGGIFGQNIKVCLKVHHRTPFS